MVVVVVLVVVVLLVVMGIVVLVVLLVLGLVSVLVLGPDGGREGGGVTLIERKPKKKGSKRITLFRVIHTMTLIHFLTGKS